VTSECHDAARELYLKKGFDLKQMYRKPIVGTIVTIQMYDLLFCIKPSEKPPEILNIMLCYIEEDV
jgi:hypothetical protein